MVHQYGALPSRFRLRIGKLFLRAIKPDHIPDPVISIYLSGFFNSCRRLPETKRHSSLFLHWSGSKFLVVMAACTPSIHVFLGRLLFLLSHGIQSIINFGILSSGILLTWPYHCSLFCCIISMMSDFPFPPIISFICSFFVLSSLYFLAGLLNTSISVDNILFISLLSICHSSVPYTIYHPVIKLLIFTFYFDKSAF